MKKTTLQEIQNEVYGNPTELLNENKKSMSKSDNSSVTMNFRISELNRHLAAANGSYPRLIQVKELNRDLARKRLTVLRDFLAITTKMKEKGITFATLSKMIDSHEKKSTNKVKQIQFPT